MAAHIASQGRKKNCPDPPRSPHRPAAPHVSMATMETASKDGKHLQRPGSRAGPHRGQEVGDAWMKDGHGRSTTVTYVEFSSAPRGVRAVALSSPPCNAARGALPPLSHPDWPVKMGAWSPQTLCVARPSAERLSEVGTVPMHTPVLSDGTERFPRAIVLGLNC